jgi:hypothetical protein
MFCLKGFCKLSVRLLQASSHKIRINQKSEAGLGEKKRIAGQLADLFF